MAAVDSKPYFLTPNSGELDSPLFIYLPGMDGTGELLQTQIPELAACLDIRCLAIPKNYLATWDVLAKNVLDLIHNELEKSCQRSIYLCGESFGGCLAMKVAAQSPYLFKRIILINPASALQQYPLFNWMSQITQFVPSSLFNLGALGLLPFLGSLERISQSDRHKLLTAMGSLPSETVNWRLSLLRNFQVDQKELQQLTQPVLLIGSGSDLLLPSVREIARLAGILPNTQTFILPNSGHACLLEEDVNLYQILQDNDFLEINRLFFSELEGTPDDYSVGRTLQGYDAASGLVPIKAKHVITNTLHPDQPTLPEIQAAYPPNLTIKLDRKNPGYTRSDEYFVLRVLNGMNPCLLKRNKQNPNQFKTAFNWDNYEKDNDHDLNNVEAFFELKDNNLVVTAITVQSRYPDSLSPHSPLKDPVTYNPKDGEKWLQAKRIFRTNSFFAAEMIEHYIKAHLQMEQYTIAAFRNLRKNPVRLILAPHVKSLVNINQRADEVLVSPTIGLVTTNGPLSPASVVQICKESMATYDWKGWKPRQPLCESHTFAKIANLYWQVLTEYIDAFFANYQDEIVKEWVEIHRLSDDLVQHSVAYQPHQPCGSAADSDYDWYDHNELDNSDIPRVTVNGTVKATRPVTISDQPQETDIDNLKQLCRYIVFHITLWHSWVNDAQADEGGEIFYNSLALRGGSFGSEDDPAIAPNILESTNLIYMVNVLTAIKYGYILKNEDDDIPQELRTILAGYKKEFAALDYEIGNIRALINV